MSTLVTPLRWTAEKLKLCCKATSQRDRRSEERRGSRVRRRLMMATSASLSIMKITWEFASQEAYSTAAARGPKNSPHWMEELVCCRAASPFEADQSPHRTAPACIDAGKTMPVRAVSRP
jgi:hypothetical protein